MRIAARQTCAAPSDVHAAACALAVVLTAFSTEAMAQTARTFYGADGRVLGRSITDSDGVTTYYDAAGRITGRTSPGGNTMTIYGADGRVMGGRRPPTKKAPAGLWQPPGTLARCQRKVALRPQHQLG